MLEMTQPADSFVQATCKSAVISHKGLEPPEFAIHGWGGEENSSSMHSFSP